MKGKFFLVFILGLVCFLGRGVEVKAASPVRVYWSSPDFSLTAGEKRTVSLMMDSGSDRVSIFGFLFRFENSVKVNKVEINQNNFSSVLKLDIASGEFTLHASSSKSSTELPGGVFEVARVEVEALAGGVSNFKLPVYEMAGDSRGGSVSFLANYEPMKITVGEIQGNGVDPILKYKVKFGSVKPTAKCAVNWPVQITVLSGDKTKVYNGVNLQAMDSAGTYKGSVLLTGFPYTSNVAVFIKGPKHLQMKYARQNQSTSYDKAGGELSLTTSAATSPEYDFTAYPMLPGDIVGGSPDEGPNGVINGVDFSYLKNRPSHESVAEGGYLKGDLDGNCQINTNDVNILKLSLETKQGELY